MAALRVIKMQDIGDLAAPKGTPAWCLAVREEARSALRSAKSTREQVQNWVHALREDYRFRALTDGTGNRFLTWEAFCETPPPYGFGMTAAEVEELIASKPTAQQMAADPEVKPLALHGNQEGESNSRNRDSITTSVGRGAFYLVRRLKRDAPDIAEALARGEYKSARAAGIAAGIVRVPSAIEVAKKACKKLSAKERKQLMAWLEGGAS